MLWGASGKFFLAFKKCVRGYEYHLRDHLGNTRVTFTTRPKSIEFAVNYENNPSIPDDFSLFDKTSVPTLFSNDLFDHTDEAGNSYTHAQRLTGATGHRVGSVIAIPVGMGDKVSAEVFAKYYDPTGNSNNGTVPALASVLVNALTGATGAVNELGNQSINNNFGSGSLIGTPGFAPPSSAAPMAFLNLMFLPEDELITWQTVYHLLLTRSMPERCSRKVQSKPRMTGWL